MDIQTLNEIKNQLWDHLKQIRGRLESLIEGGVIVHEGEWWKDRGGIKRNRWWLIDQLWFCHSEINYWKGVEVNE